MKKITIIIAILLIASVGFLIKYQSDNEKLKTDNIKLTKKVEKVEAQYTDTKKELSALKSNNQQQVKEAAERFLKAFRTYDTGKGESYLANIDAYITPPGGPTQSAPGTGDEKEKKKVSFQSEYTGGELYYAFLDTTKANVLAKVKSKITVNGVSSDNMSLMQINLIYDGNKKLWLVDKLIPLADLKDRMP